MATVKKKELDVTPGKAFNQALNNSKLSKPAPPLNSKGQPKTGGQPVAQAPARSRAATIAPLKPMSFISQPSAPKATPIAKGSQEYNPDTATRYLPPASKTAARPVAKTAARPAAPVARTAAPIKPMTSLSVSASETQPMAKREVDLNISTKRGNLFQRMGERMKQRQLARANRSVGTPMKSTTSIPSTPTPSAPQREMNATDRLKMALQAKSAPQREMNSTDKLKMALQAQKSQPLSVAAKGMLDKYMSKKYMGGGKMEYMGGGKMKSYAKGGMIEKEGMKPKKKTAMDGLKALGKYVSTFGLATEGYNPAEGRYPKKKVEAKNQESLKKYKYGGKMDKKKAFMEMIAKLKAKKKK